jgi:dnd system-associated protein 4
MSTLRRIQRESSHEEFVKDLTAGEKPLFREIWRLLLLAAAIGVKDGIRTPLGPVDSGKAIPETYFNSPAWRGFLYLVSVADSGDSSCLHSSAENQDELVTVFEEYANYGLHVMRERISNSTRPLDDLTSLVLEASLAPVLKAQINDLI